MTLFYNGGQGRYRVEKVLQPGQQLWLDVGQLIHNHVPDSDGNTLPPDTMVGSYELRDLDHAAVGLLYEGKLIIDKTYGHASYGCGTCCGYLKAELIPNPFAGPPSISNNDTYEAEEQCGGYWDDFTINASGWNSSNTAVVTLPNRTLHTLAVGTATGGAEAYLQGSKPAPACPMIWIAAQQQENVVTASFSSLVGIVQGQTANVTVTLRPSPSPVTVTLSLTTTTGTGSAVFTSTNTNTTSITQTSTITIKGVTASSTANNIRLSASALGSTLNSNLNFSVIWVTIANIYTSGSLQGDDDAANQYAVSNGTTQLNGLGPAYDGAEIKGVVTPSNFTDTITLTQTRVSYACYSDTSNGSTLASSCSNGLPSSYTCPSSDYTQCQVDATGPSGSEDSTPAPNGNIYSWDAPGTTPGSTPNTISRIRQNFAIFAVYKNVTASNVFTWFNRGSAKRNSDGSITWENTYNTSGDNQAGQENTKTSYNLQ